MDSGFTKWWTTNDKPTDLIYTNAPYLLPIRTHLLHEPRHTGLPNRWHWISNGNFCKSKFIMSKHAPAIFHFVIGYTFLSFSTRLVEAIGYHFAWIRSFISPKKKANVKALFKFNDLYTSFCSNLPFLLLFHHYISLKTFQLFQASLYITYQN